MFETFIICDNLYQGYLQTQQDDMLDELAKVLYPGLKKVSVAERISIFYWYASLKDYLSHRKKVIKSNNTKGRMPSGFCPRVTCPFFVKKITNTKRQMKGLKL